MTNHEHGMRAEKEAGNYLRNLGYKIIEKNWKTKWCEIDIVARKNTIVYFVEVKYRANDVHGKGLDYITPSKLKQMSRAAEGWVQIHDWNGAYQTAVIEVGGDRFQVTNFVLDV